MTYETLCVHRPERDYGEQMHAHIILAAATEDSLTRERTPLYNNHAEIETFKETVYRQLDLVYEIDREPERPEPEPEREPQPLALEMEISLELYQST